MQSCGVLWMCHCTGMTNWYTHTRATTFPDYDQNRLRDLYFNLASTIYRSCQTGSGKSNRYKLEHQWNWKVVILIDQSSRTCCGLFVQHDIVGSMIHSRLWVNDVLLWLTYDRNQPTSSNVYCTCVRNNDRHGCKNLVSCAARLCVILCLRKLNQTRSVFLGQHEIYATLKRYPGTPRKEISEFGKVTSWDDTKRKRNIHGFSNGLILFGKIC